MGHAHRIHHQPSVTPRMDEDKLEESIRKHHQEEDRRQQRPFRMTLPRSRPAPR